MVFDSARALAQPYCVHDHGRDFLVTLSRLLPDVSLLHWGEVDPLRRRRFDCAGLFRHVDFAHFARFYYATARYPDAGSGLSKALGPPPPDRALDDADLVVCFC